MNTNLVENNNRIGGTMNHRMNSQSDREKGIPQQVGNTLSAHGSNSAEAHGSKWRTASVRLATLLALRKDWRPTAVMAQPLFGAATVL